MGTVAPKPSLELQTTWALSRKHNTGNSGLLILQGEINVASVIVLAIADLT